MGSNEVNTGKFDNLFNFRVDRFDDQMLLQHMAVLKLDSDIPDSKETVSVALWKRGWRKGSISEKRRQVEKEPGR